MEKKELIEELKKCIDSGDQEQQHARADGLLLRFIDDIEITEVYHKIEKWYA